MNLTYSASQQNLGRQFLYEVYSSNDHRQNLKEIINIQYTNAIKTFFSATKDKELGYDLLIHKFVPVGDATRLELNNHITFRDHLVHRTAILAQAIFPDQTDKQEPVHHYFLSKLLKGKYANTEHFIAKGPAMYEAFIHLANTLQKINNNEFLSPTEKEDKHGKRLKTQKWPTEKEKESFDPFSIMADIKDECLTNLLISEESLSDSSSDSESEEVSSLKKLASELTQSEFPEDDTYLSDSAASDSERGEATTASKPDIQLSIAETEVKTTPTNEEPEPKQSPSAITREITNQNTLNEEVEVEAKPPEVSKENISEKDVKSVKESSFLRFFKGIGNGVLSLAKSIYQWFRKLFL